MKTEKILKKIKREINKEITAFEYLFNIKDLQNAHEKYMKKINASKQLGNAALYEWYLGMLNAKAIIYKHTHDNRRNK